MTDTTFSISTKASSYGCIWIQFPHTIDFTNAPDIREIFELEGRMVILPASFHGSNETDFTRNRQVIQVYSSLVRSSDLNIANQNNNLLTTIIIDDPTADYIRTVEDICKPWYPDSVDWCSCSAIWKTISCDWTANSNFSWPLRIGLKVTAKASQLSCRPISSVW